MRFFRRRLLRPVSFLLAFSLSFLPASLAQAATVTGSGQITLSFSQTPSSGFLNGTPIPITETLRTVFRTSGVTADQIDGLFAKQYTFVASTPQTIDLTALTDSLGNTITATRIRFIAIKVYWTTDNVPLLVGAAGANEFDGFITNGGKISVFPSSTSNDGYFVLTAPQTTGIGVIDSTHKLLKLDPQTAAGNVDVIIGTCST